MKRFEQLFLSPLGMSAADLANAYYDWKVSQPIDSLDDEIDKEWDAEEI